MFYCMLQKKRLRHFDTASLSLSHFLQVIPIEDDLKRQFYLTMAADQRWSKRTLKAKIDSMLYERTAIAKQPDEVIVHDLKMATYTIPYSQAT